MGNRARRIVADVTRRSARRFKRERLQFHRCRQTGRRVAVLRVCRQREKDEEKDCVKVRGEKFEHAWEIAARLPIWREKLLAGRTLLLTSDSREE